MEEGPIQAIDQNRVGAAAHLAKLPERIELVGDVLRFLLKTPIKTHYDMRIGRIHHVWRVIVDEVEPVLLMAIVHHRLGVVVAVDRIESGDVQELLVQDKHRLMRVALERDERAAA